ncbi:MAG: hypothetical protein OXF19_03630 [Hyphomicrobiales bacterium]|nr:hypothetical protein [Hyphomicrobiales bacterium]
MALWEALDTMLLVVTIAAVDLFIWLRIWETITGLLIENTKAKISLDSFQAFDNYPNITANLLESRACDHASFAVMSGMGQNKLVLPDLKFCNNSQKNIYLNGIRVIYWSRNR